MTTIDDDGPGAGFDLGRRVLPGGYVEELEQLTPRFRRIRLAGPKLLNLSWAPGSHVRVRTAPMLSTLVKLKARDSLRTYSVWDCDPARGWIDLVVFDHGTPGGVGPGWVAGLREGDYVAFLRDSRAISLRPSAAWHLFVGEETAAVAFASLLRAVPAESTVIGVQQAGSAEDFLTLPRPLTRVVRDDDPQQLVNTVAALEFPDGPGAACLAGEARAIQRVRAHLVRERGWNRRDVVTRPFWTPGRRGMD